MCTKRGEHGDQHPTDYRVRRGYPARVDVSSTVKALAGMGVRVHCLGGVDLTMTMHVLNAVTKFERTQSGLPGPGRGQDAGPQRYLTPFYTLNARVRSSPDSQCSRLLIFRAVAF